jgi:hypothetical protein
MLNTGNKQLLRKANESKFDVKLHHQKEEVNFF